MKLLKFFMISCFILSVATIFAANVSAIGMAKLKIKVIDENSQPIEGALVKLRFQGGGVEKDRTTGKTNDNGVFSTSGMSGDGQTGGGVYKDGFYKSVFHHDFYVNRLGMWQPWGKELSVVMRPIINPVPMYVRNKFFNFQVLDTEVGFDLMKADWVIPYGQGIHSDFIFKITRIYDDKRNFDASMTLTFTNPQDGILIVKDDGGGDFNTGSWFRLPRVAPKTGYQSELEVRKSAGSYGYSKRRENGNNYLFQIRSEVDADGNLIRAMYGKIKGEIKFAPLGSTTSNDGFGGFGLHYYLNPDYTSNLEFDPSRNLFMITSPGENVTAP